MKKPLLQVFAYSIVTLSVILCQKDSDEGRPYEFGFTIDGQQHRHEKKDENGIIQGEFGFITADGVYHVTVYATDENGNFKILSMRNIRISAPLDGSPATGPISPEAGKYLKKSNQQADPPSSSPAAPADHPVPNLATTPKPKAPYVFTTQPTIKPACGGCGYVTTSKPISGQTLPSKSIPQGPSTSQLHSNIVPSQTPSNLAPSAGTQTHLGVQNYQSPQQNQFGQQQEIQRPLQDQNLPAQGFVVPPTHIDSKQNVRRPVQDQNLPAQGFVAPPTDIHSQQNVQRPLQDQNLPAQGFAVPLQSQYQNSNDQAGNVELLPFQEQKLQAPHSYPDQGPPSSQSGVQGFGDEEILTNIPGIGSITNRGHLAQTNYPATAGQNADLSIPEAHQKLPPITISNNAIHVGGKNPMDIPIKDKFPGMVDGLPEGVEEADVKNILYKFKYTVGFHGHYEKGLKNGTKIGGYFVNGRDGISRVVTYVADENGYRPKFKFINLGLDSPDTPKEDTEKTFGLKSFEFVWYPIE